MNGDPEATKELLRHYLTRAKEEGLVIACDVPLEAHDDEGRKAVCALGAYDHFARGTGESLPLSDDSDELAAQWDAIEIGFDGGAQVEPLAWWRVGIDLRTEFAPQPALVLGFET